MSITAFPIVGVNAAGKSTLLSEIKSIFNSQPSILTNPFIEIHYIEEPVESFISLNHYNIFKLLEENQSLYACSSQHHITESLRRTYKAFLSNLDNTKHHIVYSDRYWNSSEIFSICLQSLGLLTAFDRAVLSDRISEIGFELSASAPLNLAKYYFLDTNLPLCVSRIHARNRPGETTINSYSYLLALREAHFKFALEQNISLTPIKSAEEIVRDSLTYLSLLSTDQVVRQNI